MSTKVVQREKRARGFLTCAATVILILGIHKVFLRQWPYSTQSMAIRIIILTQIDGVVCSRLIWTEVIDEPQTTVLVCEPRTITRRRMQNEVDPAASKKRHCLSIPKRIRDSDAGERPVAAAEVNMTVGSAIGSPLRPDVPVTGWGPTVSLHPVVALIETSLVRELRVKAGGLQVNTAAVSEGKDICHARRKCAREGNDGANRWWARRLG
jgi:hypothetical protein